MSKSRLLERKINGILCQIWIHKRTRKSITLRAKFRDEIHIGVPVRLTWQEIYIWIDKHYDLLVNLSCKSIPRLHTTSLPENLYYMGEQVSFSFAMNNILSLPENKINHETWLFHWKKHAQIILLTRLSQLSERLELFPDKTRISNAKSFWGVCRSRSIGLNWRLIGAPCYVIDYVCIHELCHLQIPNHSEKFWQLVSKHCDKVDKARAWLKIHHNDLFSI